MRRFWRGPERGCVRVDWLRDHFQFGFVMFDVTLFSREQNVDGSGRAGCGLAKGLAQHIGNAGHGVRLKISLGHLGEHREVVVFLIINLVLLVAPAAAGQGDHGAVAHVSIAQACSEVRGAYGLRRANSGTPGNARISIRHIGRGFFTMRQHALDRHVIHLSECTAQHGWHKEKRSDSLRIQKFRDKSAPSNFRQSPLP